MRYQPELYYLQDQADFPLQKALEITALTVARWCRYYAASLIAPLAEDRPPSPKSGLLPADLAEREAFVRQLVDWLFTNSDPPELFSLFLDEAPLPPKDRPAKFDHHDDTCCWVLNLSENEFGELQQAWRANGLPEDLFYPAEQQICLPYPGKSWKARLLRAFGVQRCFTPRQWQQKEQTQTPGRSAL